MSTSICCMHPEGASGFGDLHKTSYGKYSAGLSGMLFNRGSSCGACFEVRCVDNMQWCLHGSPSIVLTATDFCPPNYGLPADYGGWCNFPRAHFQMPDAAFSLIAHQEADFLPIQCRRQFKVYTCSINNKPNNNIQLVALPPQSLCVQGGMSKKRENQIHTQGQCLFHASVNH